MRSFAVLAMAGTAAAFSPMMSLNVDRRSVVAAGVIAMPLAANAGMDNMQTANGRFIDSGAGASAASSGSSGKKAGMDKSGRAPVITVCVYVCVRPSYASCLD